MNTNITQPIWPFLGRTLTVMATKECCEVDASMPGVELGGPVLVPWDKVDDMEYLAETFREFRVYEFQAVVLALGKAYLFKTIYTALE